MTAARLVLGAALLATLGSCVPIRYADCGGGTVRPADDPNHCGGCHVSCPEGVACVAGRCAVPEGATLCGDRLEPADPASEPRWRRPEDAGCRTDDRTYGERRDPVRCRVADLSSDPAHCGACGNACPPDASCVDGGCTCEPGRTRCLVPLPDDAGTGDEPAGESPDPELEPWFWNDPATLGRFDRRCLDTATDPTHCGGCNRTCPAAAECVDGECRCGDGRTFCPRETAPWEALDPPGAAGVCLDLATSQAACGACGVPCGGNERCVDGRCAPCCPTPP